MLAAPSSGRRWLGSLTVHVQSAPWESALEEAQWRVVGSKSNMPRPYLVDHTPLRARETGDWPRLGLWVAPGC